MLARAVDNDSAEEQPHTRWTVDEERRAERAQSARQDAARHVDVPTRTLQKKTQTVSEKID